MDHRCLYGHRVPGDFRFAIERNACPVCGAELVSLDGYKLARALVQEARLDAVTAFKTAKVLEQRFVITPRDEAGDATDEDAPAPIGGAGSTTPPTSGEVQLDQEDLTDPPAADVATPSPPLLDELEDAESVELISTDDTDEEPGPPRRESAASADRTGPDSGGFDAVEESFFSSSP